MGIYVYTLRKPVKHVELGHTGKAFEIARLHFLMKCSDVYGNRTAKVQVSNCEARFPTLPQYMVLGDKWENGMDVYKWMGVKAWAFDTPSFPAYVVGRLDLPALRIIQNTTADMAMKYVEGGMRFSMGPNTVRLFNAEIINASYIDDKYKKGVTEYTTADVFEMDEMGEFTIIKNGVCKAYRMNHLPSHYNDWGVRAVLVERDMTNEFEAMYS
jgi:hypothetical protein